MRRSLFVFATVALVACKPRPAGDSSFSSGVVPAQADLDEFRALFAKAVGPRVKTDDLRRMIYYPTAAMFPAVQRQDFLDGLDATYRGLTPDDLFTAGARPMDARVVTAAEGALTKHPITFVLVPGVFGEFIKTRPMEEVLEKTGSAAAKAFTAALAKNTNKELGADTHFDLNAFGDVEKPLSDVLSVASLDSSDGKALVELVAFRMPILSLESLGKNADVTGLYLRRLTKYFKLMGVPPHIVFLGYSRGAAVALDMMSVARDEPWFANVRGYVGLGGVVYGSELADAMHQEGTKGFRQLKALDELQAVLRPLDGVALADRPAVIVANTGAWARFVKEMIAIDPGFANATLANSKGADLGAMFVLLREVWLKFNLDHFFSVYSENIHRFKRLAEAVRSAARGLSTAERLAWWRTHTVPTAGLTYYSLVATMADPGTARMGVANAASLASYGPASPDYRTLIAGYRDFVSMSGFALNDSQVALHKAMLWPEAHGTLNLKQEPMQAKVLGVLATHHWALALRVVLETREATLNPYPRVALLRALAEKVAWDIQRQGAL